MPTLISTRTPRTQSRHPRPVSVLNSAGRRSTAWSCRRASARRRFTSTTASSRASSSTRARIRPAPTSSTPAISSSRPGLVDTHVHVNEPGRTEWEGFDTATRAAAAGGVTTLVDMPLNSIPATTTVGGAARRSARRRAAQCHVDVGFWGGVVPGNAAELDGARRRRRPRLQVLSRAVGRRRVSGRGRRRTCARRCRSSRGGDVPLLVHAESPDRSSAESGSAIRNRAIRDRTRRISRRAARGGARRDPLMVRLAEEFDARVHIVHVSSARRRRRDRAARRRPGCRSRRRRARTT